MSVRREMVKSHSLGLVDQALESQNEWLRTLALHDHISVRPTRRCPHHLGNEANRIVACCLTFHQVRFYKSTPNVSLTLSHTIVFDRELTRNHWQTSILHQQPSSHH